MRGSAAFRTGVAPGGALAGPWVRNPLWTRARAVPSLDLRFADNKSLVDATTGQNLVTFTRASSGTFVGSDGLVKTAVTDVPRFDHNPTTGESLGLLVEEARTNVVTWSQDLSNADWGKAAATIVSTAVASPIQGVNYQKIEATSANTTVGVTSIAVTAATQQRAISFFAQPLGNISRVLVVIQGIDARININLVDGTFTTNAIATGSTVSVSGQRFSVSTPTLTLATGVRFFLKRTGEIDTNTPTTIAIGEGLYLTGAQMEAGAFPTSYIPTTTAAATRSASLADLISSAIANNIRSFYVEFSSPAVGTRGAVSLNDNTANERADLLTSGTDPRLVVHDGGAEQANIDGGTVAAGVRTRVAVRINTNDFAISINGGAVVSDTSGTLPTVDRLMLGRTQAGEYLNGRIARFTGWTGLLPDSTLQALTQ